MIEIDKTMLRMEQELDMTQDEILDFCRLVCMQKVFIELNKELRTGILTLKSEVDEQLEYMIEMLGVGGSE